VPFDLLQLIKDMSLETIQDHTIGTLDLSISLRVCNRCITNLYAALFTVSPKSVAHKCGSQICDNAMRNLEAICNVLDELNHLFRAVLYHQKNLNPLGEFINSNI